jgi:hypothetical protein
MEAILSAEKSTNFYRLHGVTSQKTVFFKMDPGFFALKMEMARITYPSVMQPSLVVVIVFAWYSLCVVCPLLFV